MKYLIMLEGRSEKALLELIIERNLLNISVEDMLDERPFLNRQLNGSLPVMIRQLPVDEKVCIIRIGDKLTDKLTKVPSDINFKISKIETYLTRPEFEMLIIINEGLYQAFQKVKSFKKAKIFVKENVKFNNIKYDVSTKWIKAYFLEVDIKNLFKKYKKLVKHTTNQKYMLDLIK